MLQNYSTSRNLAKELNLVEPSLAKLFFEISKFTGRYKRKGDFLFSEMFDYRVLWGKYESKLKSKFSIIDFIGLMIILLVAINAITKSFEDSIFDFSEAETSTGTSQNLTPRLVQSPF